MRKRIIALFLCLILCLQGCALVTTMSLKGIDDLSQQESESIRVSRENEEIQRLSEFTEYKNYNVSELKTLYNNSYIGYSINVNGKEYSIDDLPDYVYEFISEQSEPSFVLYFSCNELKSLEPIEESETETTEFDYNAVVARVLGVDKKELESMSKVIEETTIVPEEVTTPSNTSIEETQRQEEKYDIEKFLKDKYGTTTLTYAQLNEAWDEIAKSSIKYQVPFLTLWNVSSWTELESKVPNISSYKFTISSENTYNDITVRKYENATEETTQRENTSSSKYDGVKSFSEISTMWSEISSKVKNISDTYKNKEYKTLDEFKNNTEKYSEYKFTIIDDNGLYLNGYLDEEPAEGETTKNDDRKTEVVRDKDKIDLQESLVTYEELYPFLYNFKFDALFPEESTEQNPTKESPQSQAQAQTTTASKGTSTSGVSKAEEKQLTINFDNKTFTLPIVRGYTQTSSASNQVRYKSTTNSDYFDVFFTSKNAAPQYRLIARDSLKLKYGNGETSVEIPSFQNNYVQGVELYNYKVQSDGKLYVVGYDLKVNDTKHICILDTSGLGTISSQLLEVAKGIIAR